MKHITTDELRCMSDTEGLILQGCGGDPEEWIAGITGLLTEEEILLDGDTFKDVSVFKHEGLTNILFDMENVKLDTDKLAMWRLKSHEAFGSTWLSDYVPNQLGGFVKEPLQVKELPDCPLIGADGNIFNLMGIATQTLKDNNMKKEADEMRQRIMDSGGYDDALCIIGEYVNITSAYDDGEDYDEDETENQGMDEIT